MGSVITELRNLRVSDFSDILSADLRNEVKT